MPRATMVAVRLDAMLREFAAKRELTTDATSVGGLIDDLEQRYPRLRFRLRDESGRVRPFVRVFLNGTEVDRSRPLEVALGPSDTVDILHSIQGG